MNGFHQFFPLVFPRSVSGMFKVPARYVSSSIASQDTFGPVKLHRVVVVRASDWEARQTPRSEDIYGGELKAWYLVNVENQLGNGGSSD